MNEFPFEKVWYGVELEELREFDATYAGVIFDVIPTVKPEFLDGKFQYLSNKSNLFEQDAQWKKKIDLLQSQLPKNIQLPESLVKFMAAPNAHHTINSCTACYFDLPEKVKKFNWLGENAYLFHFYRDQQDCLFWYYYVRENGENCIVVSPIPFYEEGIENQLDDDVVSNDFFYTAATFEEFIFRTFVENELWFNREDEQAFSNKNTEKICEEYVEEYKNNMKRLS
jgi:hypothetical protein